MASRVLLGVAILNETRGMGESVNDVNDDIVIARGTPSWVAVHTTMGLVSSRRTERSCSGRAVSASGSEVGGFGEESFQDCEGTNVWKFLDIDGCVNRDCLFTIRSDLHRAGNGCFPVIQPFAKARFRTQQLRLGTKEPPARPNGACRKYMHVAPHRNKRFIMLLLLDFNKAS